MGIAFWNDQNTAAVEKLWHDGLSANQIAREIGASTRNMVVSKLHRMGLNQFNRQSPRPVSVAKPTEPRAKVEKAPKPAAPARKTAHAAVVAKTPEERQSAFQALADKALDRFDEVSTPPEDVSVPFSERVTIMDLREYMCRWPMGDPTTPEFRFCGARSSTGRPYCAYHARIAYQPAPLREFKDRQFAKGLKA